MTVYHIITLQHVYKPCNSLQSSRLVFREILITLTTCQLLMLLNYDIQVLRTSDVLCVNRMISIPYNLEGKPLPLSYFITFSISTLYPQKTEKCFIHNDKWDNRHIFSYYRITCLFNLYHNSHEMIV